MDRKRPDAGFIITLFTLTIIYIIASGGARSCSADGDAAVCAQMACPPHSPACCRHYCVIFEINCIV